MVPLVSKILHSAIVIFRKRLKVTQIIAFIPLRVLTVTSLIIGGSKII